VDGCDYYREDTPSWQEGTKNARNRTLSSKTDEFFFASLQRVKLLGLNAPEELRIEEADGSRPLTVHDAQQMLDDMMKNCPDDYKAMADSLRDQELSNAIN